MCSTGPQDRPAALEEEGETYLHPLVADRSEVPRPSLEHRGGDMLGSPEGSHSDPPQSVLTPTLLRPGQPERPGWLTTGASPREQPRCEGSSSQSWGLFSGVQGGEGRSGPRRRGDGEGLGCPLGGEGHELGLSGGLGRRYWKEWLCSIFWRSLPLGPCPLRVRPQDHGAQKPAMLLEVSTVRLLSQPQVVSTHHP